MGCFCFCCFTSFQLYGNAELVSGITHHKKCNYLLDFPVLFFLFLLFYLILSVLERMASQIITANNHKGTKVLLLFPLCVVNDCDTSGRRALQSFNTVVIQSTLEYSKCRQVTTLKNLDNTGPDHGRYLSGNLTPIRVCNFIFFFLRFLERETSCLM